MPIYKKDNDKLQLVKEKKFPLEKDIQSLVESNIEELFGIQFVESERNINGLRIDTLGFDPETNSFVVIEYKRGSSFSVVDQGFSYLSLLLNNKADFILEYNERNKNQLKKIDVDWSQSRIIFVSPHYTTHQINAVNFKNAPFELWEIKQYENKTVLLNQIKNDDTQEMMPNIEDKPSRNEVMKEVKKYTEDAFFKNKKRVHELYLSFKENVLEMYPEIIFDPKSTSINVKHFEARKVVVYINVNVDKIKLTFTRSLRKDFQDSQNKLIDASLKEISHNNQNLTSMSILNSDDIQYAMGVFQQAYKKYRKDFIEG